MKLEHLTPEEILKVNIPTGVPLVYTFDTDFNVLDKRYIGDPATIAAKIDAVANQAKRTSSPNPKPTRGAARPRCDVTPPIHRSAPCSTISNNTLAPDAPVVTEA